MKPKVLAITFVAALWTAPSHSAWVPEVKFQLGNGDRDQAILWVSGFSYALDAMGRVYRTLGGGYYCTPENGYIGLKDLLDILNEQHEGMSISSEQATQTIMISIPEKFKCL